MTTHEKIITKFNKLNDIEKKELILNIGYHSYKKGLETFNKFSKTKTLLEWFETPHYDFVLNNINFIINISKKLGIYKITENKNEIRYNINIIEKIKKSKEPFIEVKVNFKRTTQPIMALVCLSSKKRIKLTKKEVLFLNKKEEKKYINEIIKKHFKENKGKLPVFGDIKGYIYHNLKGEEILVDL